MQYFGAFGLRNDFVLCLQFLKDFGYTPTRYDIVGFSTGALPALQYAMQRTQQRRRIGKILLVSPILYAPLLPTNEIHTTCHSKLERSENEESLFSQAKEILHFTQHDKSINLVSRPTPHTKPIENYESKPHTHPTKIHESCMMKRGFVCNQLHHSSDNTLNNHGLPRNCYADSRNDEKNWHIMDCHETASQILAMTEDWLHNSILLRPQTPQPTQIKAEIHKPSLSSLRECAALVAIHNHPTYYHHYGATDSLYKIHNSHSCTPRPTPTQFSEEAHKSHTPTQFGREIHKSHSHTPNHAPAQMKAEFYESHAPIQCSKEIHESIEASNTQALLAALAPHMPSITHLDYESVAKALPHIPQHILWNLFQQAYLDCYQKNVAAYYERLFTQIGLHTLQQSQAQIQSQCEVFTHKENIATLRDLWQIAPIDFEIIQKKSSIFAIFLPECDNIINSIYLSDYLSQFGICYILKGYNHILQKS